MFETYFDLVSPTPMYVMEGSDFVEVSQSAKHESAKMMIGPKKIRD